MRKLLFTISGCLLAGVTLAQKPGVAPMAAKALVARKDTTIESDQGWQEAVIGYARRYAIVTKNYYKQFVKAYRSGKFGTA